MPPTIAWLSWKYIQDYHKFAVRLIISLFGFTMFYEFNITLWFCSLAAKKCFNKADYLRLFAIHTHIGINLYVFMLHGMETTQVIP